MNAKKDPTDNANKPDAPDLIKSGADHRRERAAAQLRANLARRKSQARARRAGQEEDHQQASPQEADSHEPRKNDAPD